MPMAYSLHIQDFGQKILKFRVGKNRHSCYEREHGFAHT